MMEYLSHLPKEEAQIKSKCGVFEEESNHVTSTFCHDDIMTNKAWKALPH